LPTFAVDANCLIAVSSREHYAKAAVQRELRERLARSESMVLPAHAVTEAFSVLTRLPARDRLTPQQARAVLHENFLARGRVSALGADDYAPLLERLAGSGIAGGRIYDEVIAEAAARAGATVLLTLNPKHFPSPPSGLSILDPSAGLPAGPDENP
jgi:predicted nucleic acid-binding protein